MAAGRIHRNDTKRLIRALEVHELTGQPISSLQTQWVTPTQRHPALWIGLDWDREQLNRRINARVKQMIQAGWREERKVPRRTPNAQAGEVRAQKRGDASQLSLRL